MVAGERFSVRLLPEEGSGSGDRVTVEIGLEGLNILDASGSRVLRRYPLHHISRWSMRGTSLILFTRSPVDVEDRSVTLQGDETTVRSVLDTLTCSCMQMAEMLQSGQAPDGSGGQAAANSLNALLKKSKKPSLLTADQVEFWHHPEKCGWMQSQGEHIRTWRKRWFVLKQGFLFRFAAPDPAATAKPRGIVDLSTVADVSDGRAATGRPNSVKLSTASGGQILYLCENETSQVEWCSALEGAVAHIVKLVAGVEDEPPAGAARGQQGGGSSKQAAAAAAKSWKEQLELNFASAGSGASGSRRGDGAPDSFERQSSGGGGGGGGMVSILNYSSAPPPAASSGRGGGGGGGGGSGLYPSPAGPRAAEVNAGGYDRRSSGSDYGRVSVDYGSIAGANTAPDTGSAGYGGGGYAAAGGYGQQPQQQPAAAAPQSYSYAPQQQQPQQQQQYAAPPPAAAADYSQQQQYAAPAADYSQQQQQQQPMAALGGYGNAPHLMDAVTAPQAAQQAHAGASPWQVHYTAEGRPYFYHSQTGQTQWTAPA